MAATVILNFNNFMCTWLSLGLISNVVYQISSKSDDFSLRYGDITIFKMSRLINGLRMGIEIEYGAPVLMKKFQVTDMQVDISSKWS